MSFHIFTNIGNNRQKNEDSYLILQPENDVAILAVADGMGGHNAGEIASEIAVESIREYDFDFNDNIISQIKSAINEANKNIIDHAKEDKDFQDMGTTLTLSLLINNKLFYGHVGDSRIYIFNDELKQITKDHSLVNDLIDNNSIKPAEAFDHPQKNIITQALGIDKDLKIQTNELDITKKDIIMLCTDGLSDMIRFENIEAVLKKDKSLKEIIEELGSKALKNGGTDNITIIMGKL
ncbi:MAG TPA: Stp1/IreP family PP2C-type Ser/Thr phosphatase [Halanaerobiales bacterium]|nr:Stp1/IreP family PP2C-type Ser/Thr phosphatase [Halanaerobiales bacterium]